MIDEPWLKKIHNTNLQLLIKSLYMVFKNGKANEKNNLLRNKNTFHKLNGKNNQLISKL